MLDGFWKKSHMQLFESGVRERLEPFPRLRGVRFCLAFAGMWRDAESGRG